MENLYQPEFDWEFPWIRRSEPISTLYRQVSVHQP